MGAQVGDRIVVASQKVGRAAREGEVRRGDRLVPRRQGDLRHHQPGHRQSLRFRAIRAPARSWASTQRQASRPRSKSRSDPAK